MKGSNRFKFLSIFLVLAYLLSACSGAASQSTDQTTSGGGKPQAMEVSFTGTVEALSSGKITVSGQTVSLDGKSVVDPNVKVGDIVKVEAQVSETGAVLALKVESFGVADTNTNTDTANGNDTNANSNTNDNSNTSNENGNANDNTNTSGGAEKELTGVVDAITADSITVDGVVYQFASFTEFKKAIFAGDTVKLHVIVNADGTFTVREIEKTDGTGSGNDNSNDDNNGNNDDDNSNDDDDDDDDDNDDDNSNSNSNTIGSSNDG